YATLVTLPTGSTNVANTVSERTLLFAVLLDVPATAGCRTRRSGARAVLVGRTGLPVKSVIAGAFVESIRLRASYVKLVVAPARSVMPVRRSETSYANVVVRLSGSVTR